MSTLKKIVSLAKQIKKQAPNKFAKWTDYIKEASKKVKPVVKKAKKVAKKVIGYKKDRLKILKKTTPLIKKYIKEDKYTRAEAIRNANIDAGFMSGNHTDTNSHNVKINVMSGIKNTIGYLNRQYTVMYWKKNEIIDLDTIEATSLKEAKRIAQVHKRRIPSLSKHKGLRVTVKLLKNK